MPEVSPRFDGCERAGRSNATQRAVRSAHTADRNVGNTADWKVCATTLNRHVLLEHAKVAVRVGSGLGLALLTMNLIATWMYNLPSAPNPMFGDVHEPGRRFRQQIEGNGSGVFTSNCVRRAALPAAGEGSVLMVLGNSYTEATQVRDQEHFAHMLEQRLGDIPVLATGIPGYSVADYVAEAGAFKKMFRPDWVIIPVRAADFGAGNISLRDFALWKHQAMPRLPRRGSDRSKSSPSR